MQNEPNFKKTKMNITSVKTKYYENKQPCKHRENEPKTNPIKANLRVNEPNFAKNEPNFKPNLPANVNRTRWSRK